MGIRRKSIFSSCKNIPALFLLMGVMVVFLCSCATTATLTANKASRSYSQYIKGLLNDRLGDIDEAVSFYKRASALDAPAPAFPIQLGLDYIRLKRYKDAAAEFEKAVSKAPDDDNTRYVLALLYSQLNDTKKAIGQYEVLLARNINNRQTTIQLRRIMSQLFFLERDYVRARWQCAKVLGLDPADESGLYLLAMLDSEEGRIPEAVEGFKKTLSLYPENADAMNALAYLYAEEGINLVVAMDLAKKALEYEPENGAYVDTLGWIYFKAGDTDKAVQFLEKASKLMLDPVILDHLGDAYYKKGSLREAKESWRSSILLGPTQKDVQAKFNKVASEVR